MKKKCCFDSMFGKRVKNLYFSKISVILRDEVV